MTEIYIKNAQGQKIVVEVSDDTAKVMLECRRAEWRNNAKEEYYRNPILNDLNDKDEELGCELYNPERMMLAAEKKAEQQAIIIKVLKSLTPEQLNLVKLLKKGKSITEIAKLWGVSKASVSQMRYRIKEKFIKTLKITR